MKRIAESELILNKDGSIYHLNLLPENISDTLIFVGDQDRVDKVIQHFDTIDFQTQKREFKTVTGTYKGKRLSVISTGIGPDNIDIVLNELDALVNIDLKTRKIKEQLTSLNIIRIGTSGALQKEIPVDSFLCSTHAIGFDGMLLSYNSEAYREPDIEQAFVEQTQYDQERSRPYCVRNSDKLQKIMQSDDLHLGITATAGGFYGPQGRVLRLSVKDEQLNDKMQAFTFKGNKITNLEMETAAIYGLAKLLGHYACSMNAILANRANGTFSKDPQKLIEELIIFTLNRLVG